MSIHILREFRKCVISSASRNPREKTATNAEKTTRINGTTQRDRGSAGVVTDGILTRFLGSNFRRRSLLALGGIFTFPQRVGFQTRCSRRTPRALMPPEFPSPSAPPPAAPQSPATTATGCESSGCPHTNSQTKKSPGTESFLSGAACVIRAITARRSPCVQAKNDLDKGQNGPACS